MGCAGNKREVYLMKKRALSLILATPAAEAPERLLPNLQQRQRRKQKLKLKPKKVLSSMFTAGTKSSRPE